jgi:hypothetical protein
MRLDDVASNECRVSIVRSAKVGTTNAGIDGL